MLKEKKYKFISEEEIPESKMGSFWGQIFASIPKGQSLVLEGKEGSHARMSLLQYQNRSRKFLNLKIKQRNLKIYVTNPKTKGAPPEA